MEHFSSRWFNEICFFAHFTSGIIMTLAASSVFNVDGKVQLYIPMPTKMNDIPVLEPFWNASIFGFLAAFSYLTSVFHLIYFLLNGNQKYSIRFIEYSITASIMAFILAILTGINDVFTLVGIFGLTMSTMLFGFLQEQHQHLGWSFWFGCIPYFFMWILITWQFGRATSKLNVPRFVVALFVLEILLFSSFAIIQLLNKMYILGDKAADGAYNLLSLTSKMILVWVSFGGILGQQQQQNSYYY